MIFDIFVSNVTNICLGAQSIKNVNVLSEKTNFSALGGQKVAIFGRDYLDPLYFDVNLRTKLADEGKPQYVPACCSRKNGEKRILGVGLLEVNLLP